MAENDISTKSIDLSAELLTSTQQLFFYHEIDPAELSLKVNLLGSPLSQTFTHSRAKLHSVRKSSVASQLERKTTGVLTIVSPNRDRIPLVWAQSGHGSGPSGDILDATPAVLGNRVWMRRVRQVAGLLGVKLGTHYDWNFGHKLENVGMVLGSHAEIKLAVFGVFLLLRVFRLVKSFRNLERHDLKALRKVRWIDGTRPEFEIFFSRKNCPRCGGFLARLAEVTGVSIKFRWKDRLVKKIYLQAKESSSKRPARTTIAQQADAGTCSDAGEASTGGQSDTIEISDDEDGTVTPPSNRTNSGEIIDLTRQTPFPSSARRTAENAKVYLTDDFISGLAYCVGQMNQSPYLARLAIVDLAERMRPHWRTFNANQAQSATSLQTPASRNR